MSTENKGADGANPDPSRARKERIPKVERIREIRRRMLEGSWVRGRSEDEYADESGVSVRHVRSDAGEAQRRLAETVEESAEIRARVLGAIEQLQSENLGLSKLALKKHQIRTAVEANRLRLQTLELLCRLNGVEPPTKIEVSNVLSELLGAAASSAKDLTDE
jgi:hypothetical protein